MYGYVNLDWNLAMDMLYYTSNPLFLLRFGLGHEMRFDAIAFSVFQCVLSHASVCVHIPEEPTMVLVIMIHHDDLFFFFFYDVMLLLSSLFEMAYS